MKNTPETALLAAVLAQAVADIKNGTFTESRSAMRFFLAPQHAGRAWIYAALGLDAAAMYERCEALIRARRTVEEDGQLLRARYEELSAGAKRRFSLRPPTKNETNVQFIPKLPTPEETTSLLKALSEAKP